MSWLSPGFRLTWIQFQVEGGRGGWKEGGGTARWICRRRVWGARALPPSPRAFFPPAGFPPLGLLLLSWPSTAEYRRMKLKKKKNWVCCRCFTEATGRGRYAHVSSSPCACRQSLCLGLTPYFLPSRLQPPLPQTPHCTTHP